MTMCRAAASVLGLAALLALSMSVAAGAATRFAEPNGDGPSAAGQCSESDPCSLADAIEDPSVVDGDEVVLLPGATNGAYETQTETLDIEDAIAIAPREGDPVPVVPVVGATNGGFVVQDPGAVIRRLRIEADAGGGLDLLIGGTAEQVYAHSSGENQTPCLIGFGKTTLLRDSVCLATGIGDGSGLVFGVGGEVVAGARLRNVTAVATGSAAYGIRVSAGAAMAGANGADLSLSAVNVIAQGVKADVRAETDGADNAAAVAAFSNSNYDSVSTAGPQAFASAAGSDANQIAAPAFVDLGAGDLHQAPGSPTIDAGDPAASLLGSLDIDGDPRIIGPAPDIGADEAPLPIAQPPAPAAGAPDTIPPNTKITRRPKNRTKTRRARFAFTSTEPGSRFECRVDKRRFRPCASPLRVKVGAGRHRFRVRAIDASGNVDPTPAADSWKRKR